MRRVRAHGAAQVASGERTGGQLDEQRQDAGQRGERAAEENHDHVGNVGLRYSLQRPHHWLDTRPGKEIRRAGRDLRRPQLAVFLVVPLLRVGVQLRRVTAEPRFANSTSAARRASIASRWTAIARTSRGVETSTAITPPTVNNQPPTVRTSTRMTTIRTVGHSPPRVRERAVSWCACPTYVPRRPDRANPGSRKPPADRRFICARYWDRTSDLFRVREARYRCANRAREGCSVISEVATGFEPV